MVHIFSKENDSDGTCEGGSERERRSCLLSDQDTNRCGKTYLFPNELEYPQ